MAVLPPTVTEEAFRTVGRDEAALRYSNLAWYLSRLPEPDRPTLDALADRWFATE